MAMEMEAAEAAIRQQVSQNPNSPKLQLSREEGYQVVIDKGKCSRNLPSDSNDEAAMATVTKNWKYLGSPRSSIVILMASMKS